MELDTPAAWVWRIDAGLITWGCAYGDPDRMPRALQEGGRSATSVEASRLRAGARHADAHARDVPLGRTTRPGHRRVVTSRSWRDTRSDGGSGRRLWLGTALAVGAILFAIDTGTRGDVTLIGIFAIVPFIVAMGAGRSETVAAAVVGGRPGCGRGVGRHLRRVPALLPGRAGRAGQHACRPDGRDPRAGGDRGLARARRRAGAGGVA